MTFPLRQIPIPRSMAAVAGLLLACALPGRAAEEGVQSLFNGQNLQDWEGNPGIWSVQDGAITGRTTEDTKLKHNTFLVWKGGTVDDFELRLQYRIVNGNSGIQYRSKVAEQGAQGPIVGGYQADFEAGKTYSGILYEERGRGILAERGQLTRVTRAGDKHKVEVLASVGKTEELQAGIKAEAWNDYLILARGNRLTHVINGRVTAEVIDDDSAQAAKSGVLAFQVHVGPPMTVQFRNIQLKRLSASGASATAAAGDLDRMQGHWKPVAGSRQGEAIPAEALGTIDLRIKGNQYETRWNEGSDSGSFTLGPEASPKKMDVVTASGSRIPAIYRLQDNRLEVAYGSESGGRPTGFKTDGEGVPASFVVTYQRQ